MRLSISNIGWQLFTDEQVYSLMKQQGFSGLEIAPTRILLEKPYDHIAEATAWFDHLHQTYGFTVSSMQSIWFGRTERIFGTQEERDSLVAYTKQAVDFASAISCGNLVFGCPRNRFLPEGADEEIAVKFFREVGEYAAEKGTVIGMEANPPIYNTNYINGTVAAVDLIRRVNSRGFRLNLDIGTMIHNGETVEELQSCADMINHVHISEPGLKPIEKRQLHRELAEFLRKTEYSGFVSIEMGTQENTDMIASAIEYVAEVFR